MVEEIQCVVCGQFPYKALECRSCNKLFCKYCQLQIGAGKNPLVSTTTLYDNDGQLVDPRLQEFASAGRDGRGFSVKGSNKMKGSKDMPFPSDLHLYCPNCQEGGDFL